MALLIPANLAGTISTAYAAIFIHDGDLYLLGPSGGGLVIHNFGVLVLLLVAGLVAVWVWDGWQQDERHRQAQADAWEAARYYNERTDEARTLTQMVDADTDRIEEEIRVMSDRFEQSDREEARKHESAKRALANRGERS